MANIFHNIFFLTCSLLIAVHLSACSPLQSEKDNALALTGGHLPAPPGGHLPVPTGGSLPAPKRGPLPTIKSRHSVKVIPLKDGAAALERGDPCDPNPCLHSGICHLNPSRKPKKYMCACKLGRVGRICDKKVPKCDSLDCITLSDCLSTPDGALCVCDSADFGHFCTVTMRQTTEWQKIRKVLTVRTVVISEAILAGMAGVLVLVFISCAIHFCRVAKLHQTHMDMYKHVVDNGKVPTEVPPGWPEVSSDLLKTTICCGKSSLPAHYGIMITNSEDKDEQKKSKKSKKSKKDKKDRDDQNDNYHRDFSDLSTDSESVLYDRRRPEDRRRLVSRHAR